MKLFFMSDIHGSLFYLKLAMDCFIREGASHIIILGDELYHGPRNPLPKDYNPAEVSMILNQYKDRIIAVRGNCDSEVDQMLINYPMMSDYSFILHEGKRVFLSHGHIFGPHNLPNLAEGDVFVYGHTHIPVAEKTESIYILNPGSVSLPKDGYPNSYGILNGNLFQIKDFEGKVIKEITI